MNIKRAKYLLGVIGEKFVEIEPPDGGWSLQNISCGVNSLALLDRNKKIGKFFITDEGNINYMAPEFSFINMQSYHSSLMEMAIKQLEEKARCSIAVNLKHIKFSDLYHLLMKFHDLY